MRMIDGDESIRKIMDEMQRLLEEQSRFFGKSTGMVNNIRNTIYGLAKAVDILHEEPIIEERKNGKWIGHKLQHGLDSIDEDTCSECGERFYQIAETGCAWNYCPNCGAEMMSCDTCSHNSEPWHSEACDGCAGNRNWEAKEEE